MIAAVLQPYLFPYVGYFQLMKAVDVFVFFDDVQYIERGWVNRNRIALNGKPAWLTFPVVRGSRFLAINRREYVPGAGNAPKQKIQAAYRSFPYFDVVYPLICDLIDSGGRNVADFNASTLRALGTRFGLKCEFAFSSTISVPSTLRGQDKVIDICRQIGASHYINPPGGIALYDRSRFQSAGLELSFIRTTCEPTEFASGPCHLSIVDRLMREGFEEVGRRLDEFDLFKPCTQESVERFAAT
jgi:WbqC-like protein family